MQTIQWSPSKIIGLGFEKLKADPKGLILPFFVLGLISLVPSLIAFSLMMVDTSSGDVAVRIMRIPESFFRAWLTAGMLNFSLKVARGDDYCLKDIFVGTGSMHGVWWTHFLLGLAVTLGTLFFVIPGIIVYLGLSFATFLVVDRKYRGLDAIKESWRITKGHKLEIFIFMMLGLGVIMVGTACLGIGLVPAMALVTVSQAILYERLTTTELPPAPVQF